MKVTIGREDLAEAVDRGIITGEQADALWRALDKGERPDGPDASSTLSQFLYYLGALIVIGAMGWFMNSAWEVFGGAGLFSIAAAYALAFIAAARHFRDKSVVLSGLLIVMAVCMTPLGAYGLQKWLGLWPKGYPGVYRDFHVWVKSGWFTMEVATLAAGLIGMRFARIPFAMAPVAFTLWYMSMDVTPILFGPDRYWLYHKYVSIGFGVAMIAAAFVIDRRRKVDYAKWLYIFGALAFWGGLSMLQSKSELNRAIYCAINVVMMFCGVLLERKVFLVLGGIGMFGYIGHLAWTVFRDSLFFPFALTLVGLVVVYAGWFYHRRQAELDRLVRVVTPGWIIRLLPQNRK
ncbi:DUF2157 domain-containing protein [Anaeroselena agilis]|uniref:DUF2157 domain-containing protein n=1 Tax=Anaeroselena agilis TaxID=3063788 RepID=A0ABU3P139_9FIRM|nr:DUF2157 domain-containing protein [Selenomonadales bacterium 4137-cl]